MKIIPFFLTGFALIGCSATEQPNKVDCPATVTPELGVGVSLGTGGTKTNVGLGLNIDLSKAKSLEDCENQNPSAKVGVTVSN